MNGGRKIGRALILGLVFTVTTLAHAKPKQSPCQGWQDYFNTGQLDTTRWVVANGRAPGYIPDKHLGYYVPENVSLSGGLLTLTLNQTTGTVDTNNTGTISYGALLQTVSACGYGTYEWTMRMSSTAVCPTCVGQPTSGSVSAGFLYVNNSQTEIDFEFSGSIGTTLWLVNWLNPKPQFDPPSSAETATGIAPFDSTGGFHNYKFVWAPGKISYYIDGQWMADHTTNVPTAPSNFMINHWGTDNSAWGGTATFGVQRSFYITKASYTPLR